MLMHTPSTTIGTSNPFGAWELPEELRSLQAMTRRFMQNEIKAVEDKLPHDAFEVPDEMLRPLQMQARALGLWCPRTAAEYGGAGLNLLGQTIVAEETSRCRMGLYVPAIGALGIDPPSVIFLGTRQQIEKYALPAVQSGHKDAFVAISEASGGADPARAIRCRAVRKGDRYIINGSKMWISGAGKAGWGILFARTGEAEKRGGISCFIVDTDSKGFSTKLIPVIRAYAPYEVHLDNVEVPVENRLGEEGEGFKVANKWLTEARVPYAATSLGVAQAALEMAIEWAKQRSTFGSLLADKQAIQWMLADSEMELRQARLIVYQAAWEGDLGRDIRVVSSIAKVVATETAGRVVDRCIQIFGGLGVSKEMPLERWYRELRIRRIGEGPSEVHRMVVARHLLNN